MIPSGRSYVEQVKLYERQTAATGLHKLHGLRHAYSQEHYEDLTGWAEPAAGGKTRARLSVEEKAVDHEARMTISRELGHGREQITVVYLGSGVWCPAEETFYLADNVDMSVCH